MPWNPEVTSVNQKVQFGVESTSALGTNVAANKLLQCYDIVFGPNANVNMYRPTGRKYPSTQVENTEWAEATVGGVLDYNGIVYLLASAMGSAAPAAHGASATAKDWTFTPPVSGSIVPQTYTIEQGDAIRAHKFNYGLFTDYGFKGDRHSGFTVASKILAQPLQDGITMTGSPTGVAIAPVAGKHINVYLDSTSANLGTTLLTRAFTVDYSMASIYGGIYPLNRATLGWTAHVDMVPPTTVKLQLEADSAGMGQLSYLQTGLVQFMRVQAQGLIIDNLQTVTIGGGATGGTFTLGYKGVTTGNITYSAGLTSASLNTTFQGLSTVGSNCTVTGSNGGPYTFTFSGALASDMSPVIATNTGLTGGTPTLTSVAQAYNVYQHDMAVKVSKPNPFSDKEGVFCEEWDFTIVEDTTWGKAQTVLVTNLLTAL